jgi:predicted secreted acid phosphatase
MPIKNLSYDKKDIETYVLQTTPEFGNYYMEWQTEIDKAITVLSKRLKEAKISVVIDIDDTAIDLASYWMDSEIDYAGTTKTINDSYLLTNMPANKLVYKFYKYCVTNKVTIFFLTGRREYKVIDGIEQNLRITTTSLLSNAGYIEYDSLLMKQKDDARKDDQFKADTIKILQNSGYIIAVNVGDQETDKKNTADYQCFQQSPFYDITAYE